jgi:hypothetical protein
MSQDSGAFRLLFQENEAAQRLYVFANVIDIRKRRRSVQIHGVDKKVTTKRSCKTANDDRVLTGRQDSDVEVETEVEAEAEAEAERGTIINRCLYLYT